MVAVCIFAFSSLYLDYVQEGLRLKNLYLGVGAIYGFLTACLRFYFLGSKAEMLTMVQHVVVGTVLSLTIRTIAFRWSGSSRILDDSKILVPEKGPEDGSLTVGGKGLK